MENLQRQQAARLALEEKVRQAETETDLRSMVESHIHQQALAFRHYQAAMRGALNDEVANLSLPHMEVLRADDDGDSRPGGNSKERGEEENDINEHEVINEQENGEDDVGSIHSQQRQLSLQGAFLPSHSAPMHHMARVPGAFGPARRTESPSAHHQSHQHHEWTYEEQFRQVTLPCLTLPFSQRPVWGFLFIQAHPAERCHLLVVTIENKTYLKKKNNNLFSTPCITTKLSFQDRIGQY